MPLILSGNVASATASTGYTVDNSCRFNDDDDARISLTLGTATNIDIWTMSCWVKRCTLGANSSIFTCYGNASAQKGTIRFDSTDKISAYLLYDGGWKSFTTNEVFRDVSAWYHIVVAVDTTQAVATNRMKVYINGTQITSFATYNAMDQSADTWFNAAVEHQIGSLIDETEDGDMYLSEFVFIDGTQYAASDFGEFDSNTPTVFKPIDVSGLTFGDNGAYLSFSDSADLGADSSGNSNDFTATNLAATDQATDTPTNNFATFNPLHQSTYHATSRAVLAEGNTKWTGTSDYTSQNGILATMGMSTGKWYLEAKWAGTYDAIIAVAKDDFGMMTAGTGGLQSAGWYGMNTNISATGGAGIAWWSDNSATGDRGSTISSNDIIMMAIDIDNSKLYFGLNGTWEESGDPTSGATGTGATSTLASNTTYLVACANYGYSTANSFELNFGNPLYAISSGNADADGYGNFEYAVPSGYYALCTKNLGAYGG